MNRQPRPHQLFGGEAKATDAPPRVECSAARLSGAPHLLTNHFFFQKLKLTRAGAQHQPVTYLHQPGR